MSSAATVRLHIEAALSERNPSALTPRIRSIRSVTPTGLQQIDDLLGGGLPAGALTEISGSECSGRTTLALSFLAELSQAARVCAWIDASNALEPASAAAAGVDLSRMLWIRCGVSPTDTTHQPTGPFQIAEQCLVAPSVKKGLHGGGFGPHPRSESNGLSQAVSSFLQADVLDLCSNEQPRSTHHCESSVSSSLQQPRHIAAQSAKLRKPWTRLEQALRATDLLLQTGGFGAIILDIGSIRPEHASRIPLATWFRYRAAADKTQAALVLLTQHPCARSSAELLLRLTTQNALQDEATLFTGIEQRIEVGRQRFPPSNVISFKKPSQRESCAYWQTKPAWAGQR